ncbi:hypothetical protein FKM82_005990 [Ascaphus truei]
MRDLTPECVIQHSPPLINMGLTLQRFHYPTLLPERIPLDNRGLPVYLCARDILENESSHHKEDLDPQVRGDLLFEALLRGTFFCTSLQLHLGTGVPRQVPNVHKHTTGGIATAHLGGIAWTDTRGYWCHGTLSTLGGTTQCLGSLHYTVGP